MYLLEWSPLPAWLTIVILLVMSLYLYLIWPMYFGKHLCIPGPKPAFLFGTLKQDGIKGTVKSDMDNQALYGKVFLTWRGRTPSVGISDPDIIREISLTDFNNFANKPMSSDLEGIKKNSLPLLEDDHWKYVRSILTPTFSSGKLRQMVPIVNGAIDRLLSTFERAEQTGETTDVGKCFASLTMDVILGTAFGVQVDTQAGSPDPFLQHARLIFQGMEKRKIGLLLGALFPFLRPILRHFKTGIVEFDPNGFFSSSLSSIINQRKNDPTCERVDLLQLMIKARVDDIHTQKVEDGAEVDKDFLSKMTNKRQNRGLNDAEIIAQSLTFLLAGYETTSTLLSYFSYCMALYPDVQEQVVREIEEEFNGASPSYDNVNKLQYLDMCVNECLRMYPPVMRLSRKSKQERTVKGFTLPKGISVTVLIYAVHHNPEFWPDPETFDPERFSATNKPNIRPFTFMPFWVGPRNCVGMRFGLMEAKMAIVSLLQRFRLEMAPDMKVPIRPRGGQVLLGTPSILLKIKKR